MGIPFLRRRGVGAFDHHIDTHSPTQGALASDPDSEKRKIWNDYYLRLLVEINAEARHCETLSLAAIAASLTAMGFIVSAQKGFFVNSPILQPSLALLVVGGCLCFIGGILRGSRGAMENFRERSLRVFAQANGLQRIGLIAVQDIEVPVENKPYVLRTNFPFLAFWVGIAIICVALSPAALYIVELIAWYIRRLI